MPYKEVKSYIPTITYTFIGGTRSGTTMDVAPQYLAEQFMLTSVNGLVLESYKPRNISLLDKPHLPPINLLIEESFLDLLMSKCPVLPDGTLDLWTGVALL